MRSIAQPGIGELPVAALPGTEGETGYAPLPAIGAGTRDVLSSYGFSAPEIEALIGSGAVIQG
jgi:hypothetical protein